MDRPRAYITKDINPGHGFFVPEEAEKQKVIFQFPLFVKMHVIHNSRTEDSDHYPCFLLFLFSNNGFQNFFPQPNCPPAFSLAKISENLSYFPLSKKN